MQIRVENLKKIFGKIRALDSISFEFGSGQVVGFVGPTRRQNNHNANNGDNPMTPTRATFSTMAFLLFSILSKSEKWLVLCRISCRRTGT